MNQNPFMLGQVPLVRRLGQIPSWGPGTAPAPMSPMQAQPAAAPAVTLDTTLPRGTKIADSVYVGGAAVAIMAAVGAFFA